MSLVTRYYGFGHQSRRTSAAASAMPMLCDAPVPEGQDGDVVGLFRTSHKGLDRIQRRLRQRLWRGISLRSQEIDQALVREERLRRVHRLGDAVGEEQQEIIGGQLERSFFVGYALHRTDDRAVALVQARQLAGAAH